MLTNVRIRCVHCNRTSYFYLHFWKGRTYAALWTECPKCHKFDDVYHFPIGDYDRFLKEVQDGKDPNGS